MFNIDTLKARLAQATEGWRQTYAQDRSDQAIQQLSEAVHALAEAGVDIDVTLKHTCSMKDFDIEKSGKDSKVGNFSGIIRIGEVRYPFIILSEVETRPTLQMRIHAFDAEGHGSYAHRSNVFIHINPSNNGWTQKFQDFCIRAQARENVIVEKDTRGVLTKRPEKTAHFIDLRTKKP